ncbi:hypothetical protein [Streptomyces palmae]|uniref:DivIVA domain-containing protein n=1 Tax=Streptomyces palmae TaxID=1701085 RepID=A0A4Z0HCN7_9ACTN|nr:hypothetical protein [Streptomyces palmae]TGB08776.1 hypothetical protein E4099_14835 [Streptomyces palmae]
MFFFMLIALVVVVSAVTLAVIGGREGGPLAEAPPDRLHAPLPADRPVGRADLEALRLPVTVRGYRMVDVDDALGRLGAELAERDARIAELESALAGARAAAQQAYEARTRSAETARPEPPLGPEGNGTEGNGTEDDGDRDEVRPREEGEDA